MPEQAGSNSRPPSPLRARALVLGLAGVLLIAVVTPVNDVLLGNTTFIGNFLPPAVILLILATIVAQLILRRLGRRGLSTPEFAVVTAMWLVSCAVPGAGLMKMLPTTLIGILDSASERVEVARFLEKNEVPAWLFPTLETMDRSRAATDPVVSDFLGRVPPEQRGTWGVLGSVPWSAWARPALTWGLLFAMIWLACICAATIVQRQWAVNERLSFPLASIYSSLIASPEPGHSLNATLRSRGFWLAIGMVFALYLVNGLSTYTDGSVPAIPTGFNLRNTFTEGPLQYADSPFKSATLYFALIGITMFVPSRIVLSLWAFFVMRQAMNMVLRSHGVEATGLGDQVSGAMLAIAGVVLYVGRSHFAMVIRAMCGRAGRPTDDPAPYAIAGWGLVACTAGVVGWLALAGMSFGSALVLVLCVWLTLLVMARVVAETGLFYATIGVWFARPWFGAVELGYAVQPRNFFYADTLNHLTIPGLRESPAVFTTQAMRVVSESGVHQEKRFLVRLGLLLLSAMLVSYLASGATMLVLEYNHTSTLASSATVINGSELGWARGLAERAGRVEASGMLPAESHSAILHTVIGAAVALVLGILSLAFAWWPLHPVGYLLWQSVPIGYAWLSLFVGWLTKRLLLRYGGARLFRASLPFFIGLIVGEILSAGFWSLVTCIIALCGYDYHPIRLLPS